MNYPNLLPPAAVRGMKVLDRTIFAKQITTPSITIIENDLNQVLPKVKKFLLKMEKLKPVREVPNKGKQIVLLPGTEESEINDLLKDQKGAEFEPVTLNLGYENWKADEILKAVLPEDQEQLTSFSRIGHIIHLNLRDHLMEYKSLIAEVLRDKIPGIRTVVNKSSSIDNTYRNFQLEILIGDADFQVEVKENGITFAFDFANVYWNPRLSREHERIVEILHAGDVLYDCFAGVGPFAIPAAKKGVRVLANDLNPESFKWLEHNTKKNKVMGKVKIFNKDARDFILSDVLEDLKAQGDSKGEIHITMNLPAMATTFLDSFFGLMKSFEVAKEPIVHVYCFTPCENREKEAQKLAETGLGSEISSILGIHFVRSVAPNKDMMRVDFKLTKEILQGSLLKRTHSEEGPFEDKRSKMDEFLQ